MPLIEKIKSKGGKSTIRAKTKDGKEIVTFKDVEYKTKTSPRTVYKNVEVMDDKGTTSYKQKKVAGRTVGRDTSFTPKPKIEIGPLKRGGKVKKSKKK